MHRHGTTVVRVVVLALALVVAVPVVALAVFVSKGTGNASASAATVQAPGTPTITTTASGLTISWTGSTTSTGKAVDGYTVRRTIGSTTATVCTTTNLSCTDTTPSAVATYTVTASYAPWSTMSGAATYTPPTSTPASSVVVPGNTDTSMQNIGWSIPTSPTDQFCVTTTLTGTSSTPKAWQLLIHLDQPPFNGAAPNDIFYKGTAQVSVSAVAGDSTLAKVIGSSSPGNPWNEAWNNALLDSSKTLTVTLCDSSPQPPAVGDPSWYTVTQTNGTQSPTLACVNLTITATTSASSNPFYFGWTGAVDLTKAKKLIVDSGKTVNFVSWSPSPSGGYQFTTTPTTYNPVADKYTLTSGAATPIKAGGSTTVTACVNGF